VKEMRVTRRLTAGFLGLMLCLSLVIVAATGRAESQSAPGTAASPVASPEVYSQGAVRTTLAEGLPPGAPGQTLQLVRYDIPAGITLAVHIHPGMQIATVVSGELTYHVLTGAVQIGRAANMTAAGPGATESLSAGESTVLYPGDWVVEVPGAVHYGENLGDTPVVLLASTLLVTGEPAAIPVNPEGTPVS
jgi:quercetin dioxygenase-like cupin family protein